MGGRNTGLETPSPAPQQLSATNKRLHDGSLAARFLFCPLLNQSDATLAARLRFGRLLSSDQRSGLLAFVSTLAFLGCAERQVTPAGSLDAPPRRLSWPGRSVLLAGR